MDFMAWGVGGLSDESRLGIEATTGPWADVSDAVDAQATWCTTGPMLGVLTIASDGSLDRGLADWLEQRGARGEPDVPLLVLAPVVGRSLLTETSVLGATLTFIPVLLGTVRGFVRRASSQQNLVGREIHRLARTGKLSDRERAVLAAAAYGVPRADLADRFHVSEDTVKTTVKRTLHKIQQEGLSLSCIVSDIHRKAIHAQRQLRERAGIPATAA